MAAAAMHPSPKPPPAWRRLAGLACTRLALAAVDAVVCVFLASMWFLFWGLAAKDVGRVACGEGCAVVAAAYKFVAVARVIHMLVLPFGVVLLLLQMTRAAAAAATDVKAKKEPALKASAAAMREQDALRDPVVHGFLALMVFALLVFVGLLVKGDSPVMGSRRERMCSLIYDVGVLGMDTVNCFVFGPIMTVRIWRARMMARRAL